MTRIGWIAVAAGLVTAGCTKDGAPAPVEKAPAAQPDAKAQLRVELGECAGSDAAFVSRATPARLASGFADGGLLGDEIGEMQGGFGFGRVGTGPGGGTGLGTIGTGRYGTIGHGSGSGSGYGIGGGGRNGMARRHGPEPDVRIGNAQATGDLDKDIIRRYIRRKLPHIRYCYEKRLLVVKDLAGTVDIEFTIDPGGLVQKSSGKGMDPEVGSCVAEAIKSIQFPKPRGGGMVVVHYPFHFRPAASTPPSPGSNPDPPQAPQKPLEEVEQQPRAGGQHTVPSVNLLRGHEQLLAACFEKQPAARGAAVIEIDIDAAGAVKSSTVHGLASGSAPACVAAALKPLVFTGAPAGVQRCPVAFGTLPIDQVAAVDITADAIVMGDTKLADVASIVADASGEMRIDTLADRLKAQQPVPDPSGSASPVLRVRDPILLRPIDAAPMKVVTRAWFTLAAADADFLPAARKGSSWRLLRDVALPAVPTPTSGGVFDALMLEPPGERPAFASLLVKKDGVWIGTTRGAPPVTVAAGADQPAQLDQALRSLKQSADFAARNDLEIAAEDDATWLAFVTAADAASRAGFTDWKLVAASSLAATPAR